MANPGHPTPSTRTVNKVGIIRGSRQSGGLGWKMAMGRKLKPGGKGEKKGKVSELVHQAAWVHNLKFNFSQHRAITVTQPTYICSSLSSGCFKPAPSFTLAIGQPALPS